MKKILYVTEDKMNEQFRYRYLNISQILRNNKKWEVMILSRNELIKKGEQFGGQSLVVITRQTAKNAAILRIIKKEQMAGIKDLFDIDDLIFDYRDLKLIYNTTKEKSLFYWLGYIWGVRRIAKRVDGFLCTNEFLAGKLKRSFNKPVRVIPNSLNREQVELSKKLIKKKDKKQEKFVVGYFSGSPTHMKDFRMVEPELVKFLQSHEDVKLRVVGDMEFSNEMKKWIEKDRVEVLDKVDYLKLQELISGVDVNIAPLLINDFTNCKSELKFFEAGVVETTTIASPTYTFKKAIKDEKNGFLAKPGEWYDKLEYLYKHPEENKKIAKNAREYALKHYYGKEFLEEVEEAYDYFAK